MMKIGDIAEITHKVTEKDIVKFADVSGDYNPLHMDEEYAKQSMFKKRIAHGMLSAAYISSVLGNILPGNGAIYLSQDLKFIKPVFIGDEIKVQVKVKDVCGKKICLETVCFNQNMEKVTLGEAKLLMPGGEIL